MSLQISDEQRVQWRADLLRELAARDKGLAMRRKAGGETTWLMAYCAVRHLDGVAIPLSLQVLGGLMGEW
ncbi:hypothetical protein ACIP1U_31295 [Cupriavidus sp. NPDC089707]|uniref:hypothetical protein n=1 Tax=Cupriavidus sp. NPDC089707 TaxID=3363963 RepID=UPI00380F6BB6